MSIWLVLVLVYTGGWASGRLYDNYLEGWAMDHFWNRMHGRGVNWTTVILAVAVVILGVSLWITNGKLTNFVACQAGFNQSYTAAQAPRTVAAERRDEALARFTAALRPVMSANATPQQQLEAERTFVALDQANEDLSRVRRENPLPVKPEDICGEAPQ